MTGMAPDAPPLGGVLETVLYVRDEEAAAAFYGDVLGMRLLAREPGRSLFYRAGRSVFLLFVAEATRRPGGKLPPHGADGSVHTCFVVARADYPRWKARLADRGVPLEGEADWPGGGVSFYFRDPDGNLLEIADRDIWPA